MIFVSSTSIEYAYLHNNQISVFNVIKNVDGFLIFLLFFYILLFLFIVTTVDYLNCFFATQMVYFR